MWSNVEKVVDRGGRLDDLETRSQNLQEATVQFQVTPGPVSWSELADNIVGAPGLPDGILSNQKSKFGRIWEGLAMEDVGIQNGHLVYLSAIWSISALFGIFFPIRNVVPMKIWQPCGAF
jgi:hypothetical protein